MEEKKNVFICYLDDDGTKKGVWCDILEETLNYITFKHNNEVITIPYQRILKIKKRGMKNVP